MSKTTISSDLNEMSQFSKEDDVFLRIQFENNFEAYFSDLPEDDTEKDYILIYGIHAIVYFHILQNQKNDLFIQDICHGVLRDIKKSNYTLLDKDSIIEMALKIQDEYIAMKTNHSD
jgi:hypothetical protein